MNLSTRQEETTKNVENNLIEAELAVTESRHNLVNNTIYMQMTKDEIHNIANKYTK